MLSFINEKITVQIDFENGQIDGYLSQMNKHLSDPKLCQSNINWVGIYYQNLVTASDLLSDCDSLKINLYLYSLQYVNKRNSEE